MAPPSLTARGPAEGPPETPRPTTERADPPRDPSPAATANDGAELALAIAAHPGDTDAALAAYEDALFPRSEESAAESAANLDTMFGERGLEQMTAFFTSSPAAQ